MGLGGSHSSCASVDVEDVDGGIGSLARAHVIAAAVATDVPFIVPPAAVTRVKPATIHRAYGCNSVAAKNVCASMRWPTTPAPIKSWVDTATTPPDVNRGVPVSVEM